MVQDLSLRLKDAAHMIFRQHACSSEREANFQARLRRIHASACPSSRDDEFTFPGPQQLLYTPRAVPFAVALKVRNRD